MADPIAYLHVGDGLFTVVGTEEKWKLLAIFEINMELIQICAASAEEKAVLELISSVVKAIHHINDGLDVLFFCHIYCIGISALGKGGPVEKVPKYSSTLNCGQQKRRLSASI